MFAVTQRVARVRLRQMRPVLLAAILRSKRLQFRVYVY